MRDLRTLLMACAPGIAKQESCVEREQQEGNEGQEGRGDASEVP
jgi:hypothetical protein